MKRRDSLQQAGLLATGASHVLASGQSSPGGDAQQGSRRSPELSETKTVLATSAHTRLAGTIADQLQGDYELRLTAPVQLKTSREFMTCYLDADELTAQVVRGVDAIVHRAAPIMGSGNQEAIDQQTRRTYNLLQAAVKAGVRAVVYLSSLRMMDRYEKHFQVDEEWQPLATPASGGLAEYLGEFVCREFAREGRIHVIVLRLSEVVGEGSEAVASSPAWVAPRDVAQAVGCALPRLLDDRQTLGQSWSVFHILSHCPSSRFSIQKAQRILGYRPAGGGEESR